MFNPSLTVLFQPEPVELGSRRSRTKRRRTPSPPPAVELRGSSKRKKTATTRRIPPRLRDDETVGGGEGGEVGGAEDDVTREMANPMQVPKIEEVPLQTFSREGERYFFRIYFPLYFVFVFFEATPTTTKLMELNPVPVAPSNPEVVAMDTSSQASSNVGSGGVSPQKEVAPPTVTTLTQATPTASLQTPGGMETPPQQQQQQPPSEGL